MRNIKTRIEKLEGKTEAMSNISTGIVYMLEDGRFEYDGQIYANEEDVPKTELGMVLMPKRDIDG